MGFAAETNDVVANARVKLEAKGIDLLVANDVSRRDIGFDAEDNEVLLIDRWGGSRALPRMAKSRGGRRHPGRDPRAAHEPSRAQGGPLSDDPRAALADALGALAATLRFHRDLGSRDVCPRGRLSARRRPRRCAPRRPRLQGCQRCKLCEARNTIVFGSGNPEADLVVIGEGPGADEDAQGLPFVGRAGQLLTKMLESVKLTRDEVYITNTVLCRPPGNRNPEADELAACAPFLADKLGVIQPKVILTLGSVATQAMLRTKEPIGKLRGHLHTYGDGRADPDVPSRVPAAQSRSGLQAHGLGRPQARQTGVRRPPHAMRVGP